MDQAPATTAGFNSFAELRLAHSALLRRQREADTSQGLAEAVRIFIRRGRAIGTLLDKDIERQAAQGYLDHWATVLYRLFEELPDARLAEFDPALAPELPDSLCPYLGLDAFREGDHALFFGRDRLVNEWVERLRHERLLAVLGLSGSGKSSAVRAGLLARLKAGALPESDRWVYFPTIVPGSNPIGSLEAVAQVRGTDTAFAQALTDCHGPNSVLVVDQFEEVFTLCTDETLRQVFGSLLAALVQMPTAAHRVILAMRTDFEPYVVRLPEFQPLFERAVVRVPPMGMTELREAIESPARRVGLKFDEGLVEALLRDILGEAAALPLLQFTLLKLWQRRERDRVTWDTYRALGGGRQALARVADEFYSSLIPEEQATAKRILLRLVRPAEGAEVLSNRHRRVDLLSLEAGDRVNRVLEKLVQARLVRLTRGSRAADDQVEVAHEALIRNWPRLVEWLQDERETLRRRLRLTAAAEQWERLGRNPAALWRGALLDEAKRYEDLSPLETEFVGGSLNAEAVEAAAKEAIRQRELEDARRLAAETEARQQTEAERERRARVAARRLRRRGSIIGAVGLIALLAALSAVFLSLAAERSASEARVASTQAIAEQQRAETASTQAIAQQATAEAASRLAINQRNTVEAANAQVVAQQATAEAASTQAIIQQATAEAASAQAATQQAIAEFESQRAGTQARLVIAGQLALQAARFADSQLDLALLLGVEATRLQASPDIDSTLLSLLQGNLSLRTFLRGHDGAVLSLATSADGRQLASGGEDKAIRLWDISTERSMAQSLFHDGPVTALAFSRDGHWLASGSADRTVRLWDVATTPITGVVIITQTPAAVTTLAFDYGSTRLAIGDAAGNLMVYDLGRSRPASEWFEGHQGAVTALEYVLRDKYAHLLISGGEDGSLRRWDTRFSVPRPISPDSRGHSGPITSLTVSSFPSRTFFLSGGVDQELNRWSFIDGGRLADSFNRQASVVKAVTYLDHDTFLAFSEDRVLHRYSPSNREEGIWSDQTAALTGYRVEPVSFAFIPGREALVVGHADGAIAIWDTGNLRLIKELESDVEGRTLAFSPDGAQLASGGVLVDTSQLTSRISFPGFFYALGYTLDGQSLVLANDGAIQVVSPATGKKLQSRDLGTLRAAALSPDGTLIAYSDSVGRIHLLSTASLEPAGATLEGHTDPVTSLAFSPDGQLLASAAGPRRPSDNRRYTDATIRLWDLETRRLSATIRYANAGIMSLAISPDGQWLAVGGRDQTITLWNLATKQLTGQPFIGHTGDVLHLAFSADSRRLASAASDGSVRLWDVAGRQPIGQPFPGQGWATGVAFSPDGGLMAAIRYMRLPSGDPRWETSLIPITAESWQTLACQIANRNLTEAEWSQYLLNLPYRETCKGLLAGAGP